MSRKIRYRFKTVSFASAFSAFCAGHFVEVVVVVMAALVVLVLAAVLLVVVLVLAAVLLVVVLAWILVVVLVLAIVEFVLLVVGAGPVVTLKTAETPPMVSVAVFSVV